MSVGVHTGSVVGKPPQKDACTFSSQLELSPHSPLIGGLRQSTLAFKKTKKGSDKKTASGNENVEPPPSVSKTVVNKSHETNTRGGCGAENAKKQTLLTDKPFKAKETALPQVVPIVSTKKTRGRRAKTSQKKTAEHTQQTKSALSVSPKKQLRPSSKQRQQPVKMQQTTISGFGVCRTARQCAKDILKQREADVISAIVDNKETGMKIVEFEEKGRGIIATRTFSAGDFVVEYIGELIPDAAARIREAEYKKDPSIGSYMFFFAHANQRYCVDATEESDKLGRLINHSRLHPNCVVKVVPIDGVPRLTIFAKREIPPGEELLYDYGDRGKESLLAHPWLKS